MRSTLGSEVVITDEEIQESLWHYYYDVEKTVNYILSMFWKVVLTKTYLTPKIKKCGDLRNLSNKKGLAK